MQDRQYSRLGGRDESWKYSRLVGKDERLKILKVSWNGWKVRNTEGQVARDARSVNTKG